jgi:ribosomal protein L11 methyltransferase
MSFGTGEHQTTKLIIQMLEKFSLSGMKILDAGTGTGILSVAAVKLGAESVIGFDIDDWCYENAQENCTINRVSGQVQIRIGDINIVPESDFDMILANIQKNILLELSGIFTNKLHSKGVILLSGLLDEDEEDIIKNYSSNGFRHLETIHMDEWIAISLEKY